LKSATLVMGQAQCRGAGAVTPAKIRPSPALETLASMRG
jgi:hypothetical protein